MQAVVFDLEYVDPIEMMRKFPKQNVVFFDSAQRDDSFSRYSFIAVEPFATMVSKNGRILFNNNQFYANPLYFLKQQLSLYSLIADQELPPFQGGIAGYFGYDLCRHLERLPLPNIDDFNFDDMVIGFYDLIVAFDHVRKKSWIFSNGLPEPNIERRRQRAIHRGNYLRSLIENSKNHLHSESKLKVEPSANLTKDEYIEKINKVINYIHSGDIYQANISQRFSAELPEELTPFEIYLRLRERKPAPFSAFLNIENNILLSASPERFLSLRGNSVETRPIKGTRKRDINSARDLELATELLLSEKDRAENIMIVDLMRNDLAKVCRSDSIYVSQLCGLESYPTVHHLVSVVHGELRHQYHAIDLLRAAFPGGSITGAPKIRAMEVISEIETHRRGPYCGSIGYIGFDGTMDTSIIIRTMAIKNNKISYHVGGGIVADSSPHDEYEETLIKGVALYSALTLS